MEILVLTKDSPELNEFLPKRKCKYDVFNETMYQIMWEPSALEVRKEYLTKQKQTKYKETHPINKKDNLSHYLRKKIEKINNSRRELPCQQ